MEPHEQGHALQIPRAEQSCRYACLGMKSERQFHAASALKQGPHLRTLAWHSFTQACHTLMCPVHASNTPLKVNPQATHHANACSGVMGSKATKAPPAASVVSVSARAAASALAAAEPRLPRAPERSSCTQSRACVLVSASRSSSATPASLSMRVCLCTCVFVVRRTKNETFGLSMDRGRGQACISPVNRKQRDLSPSTEAHAT
eukprot:1145843-Pelagomonas_calceolata.AAC.17